MTSLANAIIETASLDAARLRARAYESLKAYELDPRKAVSDFVAAVRSDRGLLWELIGYVEIRNRALAYLDSAAADMRNEPEDGEARNEDELQRTARSLPSAPLSDAGEAHSLIDRQQSSRSPASETSPIPLPKRGPAELKAIKETAPRSAFDSIRLRDNLPIGDLPWRAIPKFIRDNSYEAALLMKVKAYCTPAPTDQGMHIRDLVPLDAFNRMVQEAAQVAEAAR